MSDAETFAGGKNIAYKLYESPYLKDKIAKDWPYVYTMGDLFAPEAIVQYVS